MPTARAARLTMDREGIRRLVAEELGLKTCDYRFCDTEEEVGAAVEALGTPCVIKPVMSSSGKGQSVIRSAGDVAAAWAYAQQAGRTGAGRVIVEAFVDFDYEITLLTIRHAGGTSFCAPIGHLQEDGDYRESWQPHAMSEAALDGARTLARQVTDALGGTGIFGVELFVCGDEVIFSEVSPRPHDTGMTTMATQALSEFALHVRAILGLPVPAGEVPLLSPGASAVCLATAHGDAPVDHRRGRGDGGRSQRRRARVRQARRAAQPPHGRGDRPRRGRGRRARDRARRGGLPARRLTLPAGAEARWGADREFYRCGRAGAQQAVHTIFHHQGDLMSVHTADSELKARHRAMWASGDYPSMVETFLLPLGPRLVDASAHARDARARRRRRHRQRLAARRRARCAGHRQRPDARAARGRPRPRRGRGPRAAWVPADAENLPFEDESFDVVMSSIGVMFAPHHQAAADELVRVCRPGGTIALLSWTPEGMLGELFRTMGPFMPPPPPGAQPPPLWGGEEHLQGLMGGRVHFHTLERDMLEITAFEQPQDYGEHFKAHYGPTIGARANAVRNERGDEFDAALAAFCDGGTSAARAGPLREGVPRRRRHAAVVPGPAKARAPARRCTPDPYVVLVGGESVSESHRAVTIGCALMILLVSAPARADASTVAAGPDEISGTAITIAAVAGETNQVAVSLNAETAKFTITDAAGATAQAGCRAGERHHGHVCGGRERGHARQPGRRRPRRRQRQLHHRRDGRVVRRERRRRPGQRHDRRSQPSGRARRRRR